MMNFSYLCRTAEIYPMKYDVFISYRRDGGGEFARSVKAGLELRGYSVFLDFDELKDGLFDDRIMHAIEDAKVFLFILSNHSLDRCVNEGDWVRKEVEYAHSLGRHIIPVNKNGDFKGLPDNLPPVLAEVFSRNQYSEIMIGQLFEASMDKMVRDRIAPLVKKPRKNMLYGSILGAVAVVAGILISLVVSGNARAQQDAQRYNDLLFKADAMMHYEDSLREAQKCIDAADSLAINYQNSHHSTLFVQSTDGVRKHLESVKDSLFTRNRNFADFYIARYRENRSADDKKKTLYYIDKALAIRNDADLATMRRILE